MNRIVVVLCCALAMGVAGAATRSGVVVIAEANVSDQGMANPPADEQAQSNVRTQPDASLSTGIAATASVNPALTARIRRLESSFRCIVCQNETIADSTADLAADLRMNVHEQVEHGATDAQIRDYMVTRYGDFVLYDPPFKTLTWVLWVGPFALLALAFAVLVCVVLRHRKMTPVPLTDLQRQRARRLLGSRT
jgi:cytochrome c-type biogenesis protein CcmH